MRAKIIAKQNGVIAGLDFCKAAFKLTGGEAVFSKKISDGANVKKNKVIAIIKAKKKNNLNCGKNRIEFFESCLRYSNFNKSIRAKS